MHLPEDQFAVSSLGIKAMQSFQHLEQLLVRYNEKKTRDMHFIIKGTLTGLLRQSNKLMN